MITIKLLERDATTGGVTRAHWEAVDGEVSIAGTSDFTPDPSAEGFVPYDSLTEEVVLSWIDVSGIESALADKVAEVADETAAGVPW